MSSIRYIIIITALHLQVLSASKKVTKEDYNNISRRCCDGIQSSATPGYGVSVRPTSELTLGSQLVLRERLSIIVHPSCQIWVRICFDVPIKQ